MWERMWSPPSWLWPLSWSAEMVTSISSSSSNDDTEKEESSTMVTTTTTTGAITLRAHHHGDDSVDDDSMVIISDSAWENAVAKLLDTPGATTTSTKCGGEQKPLGQQNSNHPESNEENVHNDATCFHHVRQLDSWDCGVACLLMVWEWLVMNDNNIDDYRRYHQRNNGRREWILQEIATRSVWTIDLVYILDLIRMQNYPSSALQQQHQTIQQQQLNILFCSNILQVNESLHGMEYYTKNFEQDKTRVRHRFDIIRQQRGIPLFQHPPSSSQCSSSSTSTNTGCGGLPLGQIVRLIEQPDCIAIALVDNSILTCSSKVALAGVGTPAAAAAAAAAPYTGHFILLTGTSRDARHLKQATTTSTSSTSSTAGDDDYCFVAYNPGIDETISYIGPRLFKRAWRAEGTDEDIIFLYKTCKSRNIIMM